MMAPIAGWSTFIDCVIVVACSMLLVHLVLPRDGDEINTTQPNERGTNVQQKTAAED